MIKALRGAIIDTWTRRTGEPAARQAWFTFKVGIFVPLLTPIWAVAFVVASVEQLSVLHIIAFGLLAIQLILLALAVLSLHRFHKEAARFLGVHVGWNDPPSNERKYIAWCQAKGIPPRVAEK